VKWYWVDFSQPTEKEIQYLSDYFGFQHLLIEKGPDYLLYLLMNGLLAQYSPLFCRFGDELEQLESEHFFNLTQRMMNRIFQIRRELFTLRSSLEPLRDVIKAILHPEDEQMENQIPGFI